MSNEKLSLMRDFLGRAAYGASPPGLEPGITA